MPRPEANIDLAELEKLCAMQCTDQEIAAFLGVSTRTIERRPIVGEVNPLDLVVIEAIRRFSPPVYQMVRTGGEYLTDARKNQFWSEEKDAQVFFTNLNGEIDKTPESLAIRELLYWLFPEYAPAGGTRPSIVSSSRRPTNDTIAEEEKRICNASYFQIYFRAAVPEEMFSNAELSQILAELNAAETDIDVETAFETLLDSIPSQHPKRGDFLWKLARGSDRLKITAAERLAYAAAAHAADYRYDVMNLGEAAYAQNGYWKGQ